MQVAVDGPAGSGKSTVCKLVASKYGLTYLDTGAMYRTVAWCRANISKDINVEDIEFKFVANNIHIIYNGVEHDVTEAIRTPEISSQVSIVAKEQLVRNILTTKQQEYAKGNDVIMEGRDITSVVLPNADIKVFLTASTDERANRRYKELEAKGISDSYSDILNSIIERDNIDMNREIAPLKQVDDAIYLDTTGLSLEEVASKIGNLIEEKRG